MVITASQTLKLSVLLLMVKFMLFIMFGAKAIKDEIYQIAQ